MKRSIIFTMAFVLGIPGLVVAQEEDKARQDSAESSKAPMEPPSFGLAFGLGSPGILGFLAGDAPSPSPSIGAVFFLGDTMKARLGLQYMRAIDPILVSKTTTETAGQKTVVYGQDNRDHLSNGGDPTSITAFQGSFDLLFPIMPTAVVPYAGVGLYYRWDQKSRDFDDDINNVNQVEKVREFQRDQSLGLHGLLGVEWRWHPMFALSVEYSLGTNLLQHTKRVEESVKELTVAGQKSTAHVTTETGATWKAGMFQLEQAGSVSLSVLF